MLSNLEESLVCNSANQLNELTTDLLAAKEECEALKEETLHERGAGFLGGKSWCGSKRAATIIRFGAWIVRSLGSLL